jgi:ferritin
MLSDKLLTLVNDQVNHEFYSSYLYLSMASYFEAKNLTGFAHWMKVQSGEEYGHAMKFYAYLFDRGAKATLQAISAPPADWQSPADVFDHILQHEQKVTSLINTIYAAALIENDYPTQVMLHWFINEQVEEEKTAQQIVDQLAMIGGMPQGLMMLDRALAARAGE